MAQHLNHKVQLALETVRGTAVSPMTAEWPVVGGGFVPVITNAQGQVIASSTFPYVTNQVPVGVTAAISLEVDANINNIRDIILAATKRTAGVMPSFTIIDNQQGVGAARYSGCVVRSLALGFSRSGSPGNESILTARLTLECMKVEGGQGSQAALTQATGHNFQLRHGTVLVNNVAAISKLLATEINIENELALGPVDTSNVRLYLVEAGQIIRVSHTALFDATAWRTLVEASTAAATNTITIATGTSNETVTATIASAQLESRQVANENGIVTEQIELLPYGASAASWSFGSSIGASALGLS